MTKLFQRIWQHEPVKLSRTEVLLASVMFLVGAITVTEEAAGYTTVFFQHLTVLLVLLLGFFILNFISVPELIEGKFVPRNLAIVGIAILVPSLVMGEVEFALIPPFVFSIYTAIRYAGLYIWRRGDAIQERFIYISPGVILAVALWTVSLFFLYVGDADAEIIASWATLIPVGIALYSYSFHTLIPEVLKQKRPFIRYAWKATWVLLLLTIPAFVLALVVMHDGEIPFAISLINFFFQMGVTVPFTWMVFKRYNKGREELATLQKELGQSVAEFDFLRSQINPHFLFNALNTLYGMSLQENATRTGEAIQRLGDMMRFMLDENMQEKIPLSREVDYLKNYIALQRLRTDVHPDIVIEARIDGGQGSGSVPPMLLIPFVENAFKHGISFREPSFIRIKLAVRDGNLDYEVHNSRHAKAVNDPEARKSGVGLNNVRQRLELFYPGLHKLEIMDTPTSFLVYLTLPLSLRP
jgi:two-component system LytT family sensor kinase